MLCCCSLRWLHKRVQRPHVEYPCLTLKCELGSHGGGGGVEQWNCFSRLCITTVHKFRVFTCPLVRLCNKPSLSGGNAPRVRLGSSCKVDPPEPHSHVDKAYSRAEAWWGPSEALLRRLPMALFCLCPSL